MVRGLGLGVWGSGLGVEGLDATDAPAGWIDSSPPPPTWVWVWGLGF